MELVDLSSRIEDYDTRRIAVEQHQAPARVARRDLDSLAAGEVLPRDAPAGEERSPAVVLPDPRWLVPAEGVLIGALVDAIVRRHVRPRWEGRLAHPRADARVPSRPLLGRLGRER